MTHPPAIGPYIIEREIARGGMGVVYLAHDERLSRTVAIKSLPADLADSPERLARFEREAKALAALNHTNIAGIHSVEEVDGARYLVLEYVDGLTLSQRLEQGPLPIDDVLDITAQIARGVEAAHEAGVIHRDLKPGNIIIRPDGVVKVVDFGLAKEIESSSSSSLDLTNLPTITMPNEPATAIGQVLGTPAFLSPEQARGKQVDRRTDIWSFGCVLFECLTGAARRRRTRWRRSSSASRGGTRCPIARRRGSGSCSGHASKKTRRTGCATSGTRGWRSSGRCRTRNGHRPASRPTPAPAGSGPGSARRS